MAKLNSIVMFLNKELKIKRIEDKSYNGLQVKCKNEINKIGFAVDACISTIEKAKKQKIDLLIVHHGIKWKGKKDDLKLKERTINFLKKYDISLYGVHLPLDMHEKYGNNIQLANLLKLEKITKFGKYNKKSIGYKGIFKKHLTIQQITNKLNKELKTNCQILNYGKKQIKIIGIVSGGGSSCFKESLNLDCFLLGEAPYHISVQSRDLKHNVIIAGHYATETLGVKALMPLLKEKFNVRTIFIDNPTNL